LNLLVHDEIQHSPSKAIYEISCSFSVHLAAWRELVLSSLWVPLVVGWIKGNSDVAVKGSFKIAVAVISNKSESIIRAATQKLHSSNAMQGEALAALLASR
jgi:hypothetical protein